MASSLRRTTFIVPHIGHLLLFAAIAVLSCNVAKQSHKIPAAKIKPASVIMPAQHLPTAANVSFVYDNETLFTAQEQKKLDSLVRIFEKSNLISIRVTTINNPQTTASNFDAVNKALLTEWGALHGKSDKCMSISIGKSLSLLRIDYGTFVNRLLSDDEAAAVVKNHFKPHFQQNQYYQGTLSGLQALMDTIRRNIKF